MESTHVTYRIKVSEEHTEVLDYELDGESFDLLHQNPSDPPDWARLEYKKCPHCPLDEEEHPFCPVALQLHDIIERFHDTRSIDEVEVEVISEERKVVQTTAIQTVIASLFGLVFPLCGCPKTAYMKPMARFHLPLASEEESIFHVTGMYLLSQYFLHKGNNKDPFEGLSEMYADLHLLNKAIKERITDATASDSAKNAITLIDMNSTLIPLLIEDELVELRGFFKAYLPEDGGEPVKTAGHLEKAKAFKLELMPIEGEEQEPDPGNPFALPDEELPAPGEEKGEEEEPEIAAHIDTSGLSLEPIAGEEEESEESPEPDHGVISTRPPIPAKKKDSPGIEPGTRKSVFKLPED